MTPSSRYHFVPYEEAARWARDHRITNSGQWRDACKDKATFPSNVPTNPDKAYKGKGWDDVNQWNAFLGQTKLSNASRIELALKRGLLQVLDLDVRARASIDTGDGKRPVSVDLVDRNRRLVIEYDGAYWHRTEDKEKRDREKTARLAAMNPPWTLIRVREAPLELLDPRLDIAVPQPKGRYAPTLMRVLHHLRGLIQAGTLPDDGLLDRVNRARATPMLESDFQDLSSKGWRTIEDAAAWAQAEGITTQKQWKARCADKATFPDDIPTDLKKAYGNLFTTLGEFLGTGRVSTKKKVHASPQEAAAFALSHGITTVTQWASFDKPANMPSNVKNAYGITLSELIGTGRVSNQSKTQAMRSCEDASFWAQSMAITGPKDWKERIQAESIPSDIPKDPYASYQGKGWPGWAEFLGPHYTGRIIQKSKKSAAVVPSNDRPRAKKRGSSVS